MIMPAGYITLYDAARMLVAINADTADIEEFNLQYFAKYFIRNLGGEIITAVGWDTQTGNFLEIPANYWRKKNALDVINFKKHIRFVGQNRKISPPVLVLIKFSDSQIFTVGQSITEYVPEFDATEWDDPAISEVSQGVLAPKNLGGRPPTHNWEAFFAEVALVGDRDNLKRGDSWMHLRRHMIKWTKDNWPDPPDESTIKKKLKIVEDAWTKDWAKPQS